MAVMVCGLFALSLYDPFLEKKKLGILRVSLVMLICLTVFDVAEDYLGNQPEYSYFRIVFSCICYSLRPAVIMMMIFVAYEKAGFWVVIPAVINAVLSFTGLFSPIVFTIEPANNTFIRGPLGYFPHATAVLYIIGLFLASIRVISDKRVEESIVMVILTIGAGGAMILSSVDHDEIVNTVYAVGLTLYYLFTYASYTKKDGMTGLLNRQSFYSDAARYGSSVTGIISIDMNELKWLNDNLGHEAGDKALMTVSDCFRKNTEPDDRIYRVGGDEFFVICRNDTPDNMRRTVDKIRSSVDEAGYSCAYGLSMKGSFDDMVREADKLMYEDKARIKASSDGGGKKVHFRS